MAEPIPSIEQVELPLTLRSRWRPTMMLIALFFFALGALPFLLGHLKVGMVGAPFWAAFALLGGAVALPCTSYLRLSRDGIEVRMLLLPPTFTSWREVTRFYSYAYGQYNLFWHNAIAWDYAVTALDKPFSGALQPGFCRKRDLPKLVTLLNDLRQRYG